jgi:uncharacterized protein (TIGR00251 family)
VNTFIWNEKKTLSMTSGAAWATDRGTFLRVIVRPNSREQNLVSEISDEAVHVNLRAPAREGRANTELVKKLAKRLGMSTADIVLAAGHKSRDKTLILRGMDPEEVLFKLSAVV